MINQLKVLNTVQANGADAYVDSQGSFNVTGLASIPAAAILDVKKIPYQAEQTKKQYLTFTSANSTAYQFTINGYLTGSGASVSKTISYTSPASSSTAIISAAITALVNGLSGINVTATDVGSGVVLLTGASFATYPNCVNAPTFTIAETDANIALTTVTSVSFAAAPTGGRTAQGYAVVADAGTVSSIVITDGGEGYTVAPAITIANGGGSSATATSVIFEGEVVKTIVTNAGSAYTSRQAVLSTGTYAAIVNKYNYVANSANSPSAPDYPELANLNTTYNYSEWIISYQVAPIGGITTFSSTTTTGQMSILVYESATNVATINSAYGTLNNLRKGYRSTFSAAVALDGTTAVTTTTFVVATGVFTLSAANSNAISAGDLLIVGATPDFANTADTNAIALVAGSASNTSVIAQIGGGNLIAAITTQTLATSVVKRRPISR